MQVQPLALFPLLAADDELVVFDPDRQVGFPESRHREGDTQAGGTDLLDVVGRIAFRRHLGDAVKGSFEVIEAQEIGRASCRERVCQYVSISVVAVSLKKKIYITPR